MPHLEKPFRQNIALAVDGGGIRGVMVTRALMVLEEALGVRINDFVRLTAGTSTGAIIAAGIARGLNASAMHDLYVELGPQIFRKTWRNLPGLKYLLRYQYDSRPLEATLTKYLGNITMGRLHAERPDFNMVITATDVYANTTRFIKLYKPRYMGWRLRDAVMASSVVPTIFPVYQHRYATPDMPPPAGEEWIPEPRAWVDGGIGSYSNPSYLAAYEIAFCLADQGWRLDNTTLISIGTGKPSPRGLWKRWTRDFRRNPRQLFGPEWVFPTIETFIQDANLQQLRLVRHFFVDAVAEREGSYDAALDFRRFNVELDDPIDMDDAKAIPRLSELGEELGRMILADKQERFGTYDCGAPVRIFSMGGSGTVV
ncbi:MAG: patatin-like phospholipase family protein [Aggregatilineales bacterium]|nr:patatin-like phospholipase family protein [Chloroflexota bacterium]HOA22598.1 patatin-like phospholipase family protein [Aggregatilineales bacterium]